MVIIAMIITNPLGIFAISLLYLNPQSTDSCWIAGNDGGKHHRMNPGNTFQHPSGDLFFLIDDRFYHIRGISWDILGIS